MTPENYDKALEDYETNLEDRRAELSDLQKDVEESTEEETVEETVEETDDESDTLVSISDLVYKEALSDEEMKKLIDYEISKGSDSLYLYNIESLTDNQARMIKENSNIFESVFLPSLNRLTPNQANLLSNIKSLDLRWMKEVSNDVLKELWKWNIETLELRWLEKFTDNQAEILAKSNIKTIEIEPQVLSPKWKDILKDKLS